MSVYRVPDHGLGAVRAIPVQLLIDDPVTTNALLTPRDGGFDVRAGDQVIGHLDAAELEDYRELTWLTQEGMT
ncbi:hypothetical protein NPS74_23635, partial [Cutibacterium acnes subsp. acnes]|nr:hypothetical protein [Cutibacterium acnes subsp. acnes]